MISKTELIKEASNKFFAIMNKNLSYLTDEYIAKFRSTLIRGLFRRQKENLQRIFTVPFKWKDEFLDVIYGKIEINSVMDSKEKLEIFERETNLFLKK
jgi:hypothetical protein